MRILPYLRRFFDYKQYILLIFNCTYACELFEELRKTFYFFISLTFISEKMFIKQIEFVSRKSIITLNFFNQVVNFCIEVDRIETSNGRKKKLCYNNYTPYLCPEPDLRAGSDYN